MISSMSECRISVGERVRCGQLGTTVEELTLMASYELNGVRFRLLKYSVVS